MGSTIYRPIICNIIIAFALLLLPHVATAFPCERMKDVNSCKSVLSSSLSEDEKMQTLASMIDDVRKWNTDFKVSTAPTGKNVVNNELVSNAWIRIFAVLPSIHENNKILSPGTGEIVAKSNYKTKTLTGREKGDCKTLYSAKDKSRIVHYLNGIEIGKREIVKFKTNSSILDFRANLVIDSDIIVKHYRYVQDNNGKRKCVYKKIELRKKTTVASDSLKVYRYQSNITYNFKVQNKYYGTTQIHFNASNYTWFRLQFNNKDYYEESQTSFERFFSLTPYYILNFKPTKLQTLKSEGVRHLNTTFYVTNTNGCKIILADYFNKYTKSCQLKYTPLKLSITTDKQVYAPQETIKVSIQPNIPVQLTYGNKTITAQRNAQFLAQSNTNVIYARANGVEAFHAISVINPDNWKLVVSILVFLLVAYILWKIIMSLLGRSYALWNS